eukprot:TRINITY_DN27406_c0_g2_i1.p1 TRINITY_DN27406_c0_g2~~TRINITY_DN27406_c0_g2_i1.p1  ORF type:complete len:463 (-),score=73.60 TRINITY_DN27406_c0_g2_i1:415-1803(-)
MLRLGPRTLPVRHVVPFTATATPSASSSSSCPSGSFRPLSKDTGKFLASLGQQRPDAGTLRNSLSPQAKPALGSSSYTSRLSLRFRRGLRSSSPAFSDGDKTDKTAGPPVLPRSIVESPKVKAALPYVGNLAYFGIASGFLMTDVLLLRVILAGGYSVLVAFHSLRERPLRIPLAWSVLFVLVNLVMAIRLFTNGHAFMSPNERKIYHRYLEHALTETEWKQLVELGTHKVASERNVLITKNSLADLIFLTEGAQAEIEIDENYFIHIDGPCWLGESCLYQGGRAIRTVYIKPGANYFLWKRDVLLDFLKKDEKMWKGLENLVQKDISSKLQRATNALVQVTAEADSARALCQEASYKEVIVRKALELTMSEHKFYFSALKDGRSCETLFEKLHRYREEHDISEEVHAKVLSDLGLNEQVLREQHKTLSEVCATLCKAPKSHLQPPQVQRSLTSLRTDHDRK